MTDAPLSLTADMLPRGFSLKQGPVTLETHRVHLRTYVRLPGITTLGIAATDEGAIDDLVRNIAWWFKHDGPSLDATIGRRTKAMRALMAQWEALQAVIAYEAPTP